MFITSVSTIAALLVIFPLSLSAPVSDLSPSQSPLGTVPDLCWCAQRNESLVGKGYLCDDELFGPVDKPASAIVTNLLVNYHHFGGKTPCEFFEEFFNYTHYNLTTPKQRYWKRPPNDGWQLDNKNKPIYGEVTLHEGTLVDRFGGENGKYLSLVGEPFAYRSLPPNSLFSNNYHRYRVLKDMNLTAGQAAPYYRQRGMGTQYFTGKHTTGFDRNVGDLVRLGFIIEESLTELWFP